jgi:hypothetical protein
MKKAVISGKKTVTSLLSGSKGFGTVEIVLITAVLIALAMMFRTAIISYADRLLDSVFTNDDQITFISDPGESSNG